MNFPSSFLVLIPYISYLFYFVVIHYVDRSMYSISIQTLFLPPYVSVRSSVRSFAWRFETIRVALSSGEDYNKKLKMTFLNHISPIQRLYTLIFCWFQCCSSYVPWIVSYTPSYWISGKCKWRQDKLIKKSAFSFLRLCKYCILLLLTY